MGRSFLVWVKRAPSLALAIRGRGWGSVFLRLDNEGGSLLSRIAPVWRLVTPRQTFARRSHDGGVAVAPGPRKRATTKGDGGGGRKRPDRRWLPGPARVFRSLSEPGGTRWNLAATRSYI
jgi:hypothetical protein